ncbi:MAG: hypothetical protein PHX82_14305 [Paracoccaceae bacterium]|nr:hypothetical protein [Paracoccaceae bacterium]
MTSIADCIQRAIDAKDLNPVHGRAAQDAYHQLVARYEKIFPAAQAQAKAAEDLREATRRASRSRAHKVLNELQAARRLIDAVNAADDPGRVIRDMIEGHTRDGYRGESVRGLMEAYTDTINATLAEVLQEHGLNVIGSVRNRLRFMNVIRELHGQKTGDAAAEKLAEAVRAAQRRMRQLYNAYGGDIGELVDYGIAHAHSAEMLIKHGFDKWARDITPLLDWSRIVDLRTGQPFAAAKGALPDPADAQRFLKDIYDGIVTRGWDDRTPSQMAGGKALYNQRGDHRVLHFRDGDTWLTYNQTYGQADAFSAMINSLHGLARDVAMMRVLGPNPRGGLELAIQTGIKRAEMAGDAKMAARVHSQGRLAKVMLAHVDGSASVPDNIVWAALFSGTRGVLASTQLGSAILSSVTDVATIRVAAKVIGLKPSNVMTRTMSLSMSGMTRKQAARLGYVAQTLGEAGGGSARYFGDLLGTGITSRLSGFTLRASGLNFVTDMRRIAFQMETSAKLADMADLPWDKIDPKMRAMMEKRGLTAQDWDHLRAPEARFVTEDGADFISAHWYLEHQTALPRMEAEGIAMRLQMAIREELEFALPTMSIEGKARVQGDAAPGSIPGEMLRSTTGYKGYPLSLTMGQYRRFMQQSGRGSKAEYAANLLVPLVLLGAVAIQLKEVAKGNDPRPMDDRKFWWAALFQSGGLGIFGDFFAAEASRTGGGLGEALSGPVFGLFGDAGRLVAAPAQAAIEGRDMNWGRAAARFQRMNTPVLSSLWYARAAFDRTVSDTIQEFLDPEARADWRRRERQQQKDYGTQTFLPRGENQSYRLPDLTNALGDFAP